MPIDLWEYKVVRFYAQPSQPFFVDENMLQQLGSQGWELVNTITIESRSRGLGGSSIQLVQGFLATATCDFIFKRRR